MDYRFFRSQPVETAVLRALACLCGYPVACRLLREGERLGYLVFFDDEPAGSTFGRQIEHCPTCTQKLALHRLLSRIPRKGKPTDDPG